MTLFLLDTAIIDGVATPDVLVEEHRGVITSVTPRARVSTPDSAVRLPGVTLPGLASAHSHAFHRALRGRTHADGGTFWSWRALMYHAAGRLTPSLYFELAKALFGEMLLAGYTAVGEFHYVHGREPAGGTNDGAMERVIIAAADATGIRLTLLDTLYLHGGLADDGTILPLSPRQARFSDGTVDSWIARHATLAETTETYRRGMAAHSLRAVSPGDVAAMRQAFPAEVLHAHVSEQPAENAQVGAQSGRTPVRVLADAGVLDDRFTGVHLTHLTDDDVQLLGDARATACFCPTTERDLADGIGPARALSDAGVRIALGSDQNAVVDPFEEMRALEMHERLSTGLRGRFAPASLLAAGTVDSYASIGWNGGRIAVGAVCDLVSIDSCSPRTAGADPAQLWFAATSADVRHVVVGGRSVVQNGRLPSGDVGADLAAVISALLDGETPA